MNARCPSEQAAVAMVDAVGFKWLMAHEGHAVNVERLQHDADYARECLALADASASAAVRAAAVNLRNLLLPPRAA
jgi:hypothetical protein